MQTDISSRPQRRSVAHALARARCWRPVAAACALLLAGGAWADDPIPYYFGADQAFTHDSNVFRTATDAQADTYSSTGLLAGIDQPFGRQHFFASGDVRDNRYHNLEELNNTSYGLKAGLDWSTINRLSGNLYTSVNQGLANYGSTNQLQLTTKNIQTSRLLQAQVQWGLASLLSLQGGVSQQQVGYSAVEYAAYETKQDSENLGIFYSPSALLTVGSSFRHIRATYPAVFLPNGEHYGFGGNYLDLTASWLPTGQSTINARLSFGRLNYDGSAGSAGDKTTATTGALTWSYLPTGRLSFNTTLSRDSGQDSTTQSLMLNGTPGSAVGDNSRLTTSLSVNAGYAATAKIKLAAAARYSHRSLVDTVTLSNGVAIAPAEGGDNIHTLSLSATYTPTRSLLFSCNVARDARTVSASTPVSLSYPFNDNRASCSAQFTVQ